jgi:hypothetical protein
MRGARAHPFISNLPPIPRTGRRSPIEAGAAFLKQGSCTPRVPSTFRTWGPRPPGVCVQVVASVCVKCMQSGVSPARRSVSSSGLAVGREPRGSPRQWIASDRLTGCQSRAEEVPPVIMTVADRLSKFLVLLPTTANFSASQWSLKSTTRKERFTLSV